MVIEVPAGTTSSELMYCHIVDVPVEPEGAQPWKSYVTLSLSGYCAGGGTVQTPLAQRVPSEVRPQQSPSRLQVAPSALHALDAGGTQWLVGGLEVMGISSAQEDAGVVVQQSWFEVQRVAAERVELGVMH